MGNAIIPYEPYHPHLGYTILISVLTWGFVLAWGRFMLREHPWARVVMYGVAIAMPVYAEGVSFLIFCFRPAPDTPIGFVLSHFHASVLNRLPLDTFFSATIIDSAVGLLFLFLLISLVRYYLGTRSLRQFLSDAMPISNFIPAELFERIRSTTTTLDQRVPMVMILLNDSPLALTAGVFHPRIYISQALLDILTPDELLAVICHEWAHVLRHDNLWNSLVRLLRDTIPFLPGRTMVWNSMLASQDEACDALAVSMTHQPLVLARALLKVTEAWNSHATPHLIGASSFALGVQQSRVRVEQMLRIEVESATTVYHRWPVLVAYISMTLFLLLGILPALLGS